MKISKIELFKLNVPLKSPFVISLETITHAENVVVRLETDKGLVGWGECSPYKTIAGETRETCFAVGQIFAKILKGANPLALNNCLIQLDRAITGNRCIKSAFDIALYDLAAQAAKMPLYEFLGGENNRIIATDMTVGIGSPAQMSASALAFKEAGFEAVKVKLGTNKADDLARIRHIRAAVGAALPLRIDANQGWDEVTAIETLKALAEFDIEHCEQPVSARQIQSLANVRRQSPIPIMADESVFDAVDALNLVRAEACDFFNIKFAKSGGIHNALKINAVSEAAGLKNQVGCFSETRLAMTALMHFIMACPTIVHFDLDAPLMLSEDPVLGGCTYLEKGRISLGSEIGLGAWFDENYLKGMESFCL
jgi:L-Ala-D/L-Glu epimerase